ncbi:orotate phosphoribosyltransferase [Lactococcus laudensis]|uniref:Orotate phosphoribosyltransferase n=1 Tax=Pseudolactococcus laudensis TaxID=1494461 RepID=A0A7V8SJW3_9LACT|nr:orotate phosphoribosyltransferase [Lactococcus laudensis]MBA0016797.1 orotate phosphoribosyltransferase [Lactococcus laudensis]MBW9281487.1 orotate phosphoribosyltransferase [Lactococcus laudensis]
MQTLSREIAKDLLDIKAVFLQPNDPFTWASGIKSPIYTDNRITISYPEVRRRIVQGFADRIRAEFPDVEVIAGAATGGVPHAAWVAEILDLPMVYIRSKAKDHGAGNQVEGRITKNQKMVIIEDLISTGGSVIGTAEAASREGADVLGVAAIFTYELPRGIENFEKANLPLITLSNYSDLIEIAKVIGYVDADELELLKKFKQNQNTWQD